MLSIRSKYEQSLNGLEVSKEIKKQNMKRLLEKKLERRREQRKKELLREGNTLPEAEKLVALEDSVSNVQSQHEIDNEIEASYELEKNLVKKRFQEMADYVEKKTGDLTEKENQESKALREGLIMNHISSLTLQHEETLSALTATRDGIKDIMETTQSHFEKLRSDYAEEMRGLKAQLAQEIARELGRKYQTESEEESTRKHDEMVHRLEAEYQQKLLLKQTELSEQMKSVLAEESKKANIAKITTAAQSSEAQAKVQNLKELHERALSDLQESLKRDMAKQESSLKQRIEMQLKQKLQQLSEAHASEEERLGVIREMETSKKIQLVELNNRLEEKNNKLLAEMEEKHSQEMAAVMLEARQKEMCAVVAAAREAALETEKQTRLKMEHENNMKALQQIHELHGVEQEKLQQNQLSRQKKERGRLQDRLAEKKAKKERELKVQEARALEELTKKQELEKEEKERLRQAKMVWSERIQETFAEATQLNLDGRPKEDYCFRETLGKGLVPDTHLSEAAQMILGARHSEEMSSMLRIHYTQRQAAIKEAVEKVMHEKAEARIALVDKLVSRKSTDEFIKLSLADLDTKFIKKQSDAEEGAIILLEREHTKQQMSLRQRQLEEISGAINLYSNLVHVNQKSPQELMMEYRLELEKEKERQEKEIMKEREEREKQLRAENEAALRKLEQDLQKSKDEEEAAVKLNQFEYHKKKAEESEKKRKEEQQMILDKYKQAEQAKQEALSHERQQQKNKTQARREEKRRKSVLMRGDSGSSLTDMNSPREGLLQSPRLEQRRTGLIIQRGDSSLLGQSISEHGDEGRPQQALTMESRDVFIKSVNLIEEKLSRLDSLMRALEANLPPALPMKQTAVTTLETPSYQDAMNPPQGRELILIPSQDLSVQEAAKLTFSQHLLQLLGLTNLDVQIAKSLPPCDGYENNAFKNSYFYDDKAQVLFIHLNRLSSSGDFGLVAIHALSHIKVAPPSSLSPPPSSLSLSLCNISEG